MKYRYERIELDFDKIRKMSDEELISTFSELISIAEDNGYTSAYNEIIEKAPITEMDEDDFHSAIAGMRDY